MAGPLLIFDGTATASTCAGWLLWIALSACALAGCTADGAARSAGATVGTEDAGVSASDSGTTAPLDSSAADADVSGGDSGEKSGDSGSPITHVTYDFTNVHAMASYADTWDTAWASDGNLYSTYCDGDGFGSRTYSDFGIAKITGSVTSTTTGYDYSGLTGSVVNTMLADYGLVCGYPWWKTGGLTSVGGVLYLFVSPNMTEETTQRQLAGAASLIKSTDLGATWSTPPRQYANDQSTNLNFQDGTLHQWTVTLATGGSASIGSKSNAICNTPVAGHYAILVGLGTSITKTLSGLAPNTHFRLITQAWTDGTNTVRVGVNVGGLDVHQDATTNHATFMIAVSTDFTTDATGEATIYITNVAGSSTGTVDAGLFRLVPSTFPGQSFGAPVFVKYGKDGAGSADGAGQYVYAMSNNGYFSNGDYAILGRVARTAISKLRESDWQFYTGGVGGDGSVDANWASSVTDPSVTRILDAPGNVGMMDVAFIAPLERYVMLEWGWLPRSGGRFSRDSTTSLDAYEAPHPWGPWTKIGSSIQSKDPEAFYDPHIIGKFTTVDAKNPNLVHAMVSTAGEWAPSLAPGKPYYKMTLIPLSISKGP